MRDTRGKFLELDFILFYGIKKVIYFANSILCGDRGKVLERLKVFYFAAELQVATRVHRGRYELFFHTDYISLKLGVVESVEVLIVGFVNVMYASPFLITM